MCDVILSFSNVSENLYVLPLIDRERFDHLTCPFVYFNVIFSSLFSVSLVLSLLCLATDHVVTVFKPLSFRTSAGRRRMVVYGVVIFTPVPLTLLLLIYWSSKVIGDSGVGCVVLMTAASEMMQYPVAVLVLVAFSTSGSGT